MNRWWLMLLVPVVLLSACRGAREPQRTTEPTPSVTSAPDKTAEPTARVTSTTEPIRQPRLMVTSATGQIMQVAEWEIKQAADGTYYIPDRGDGCTYYEVGRAADIMLWATPPVPPQCVAGWSYNPTTGRIGPVVP